jgi:hypothetical protein
MDILGRFSAEAELKILPDIHWSGRCKKTTGQGHQAEIEKLEDCSGLKHDDPLVTLMNEHD